MPQYPSVAPYADVLRQYRVCETTQLGQLKTSFVHKQKWAWELHIQSCLHLQCRRVIKKKLVTFEHCETSLLVSISSENIRLQKHLYTCILDAVDYVTPRHTISVQHVGIYVVAPQDTQQTATRTPIICTHTHTHRSTDFRKQLPLHEDEAQACCWPDTN